MNRLVVLCDGVEVPLWQEYCLGTTLSVLYQRWRAGGGHRFEVRRRDGSVIFQSLREGLCRAENRSIYLRE